MFFLYYNAHIQALACAIIASYYDTVVSHRTGVNKKRKWSLMVTKKRTKTSICALLRAINLCACRLMRDMSWALLWALGRVRMNPHGQRKLFWCFWVAQDWTEYCGKLWCKCHCKLCAHHQTPFNLYIFLFFSHLTWQNKRNASAGIAVTSKFILSV